MPQIDQNIIRRNPIPVLRYMPFQERTETIWSDETFGDMSTPSRDTDSHYHLNVDSISIVVKAFDPHHIDHTLYDIHREKIKAEFHVNLY